MRFAIVRPAILASILTFAMVLSVRPVLVQGQATFLNFNGFNQAVIIADSVNLDITGAITIEARIFVPSAAVGGLWIASKIGTNSGYELMLVGSTLTFNLNQEFAASMDFTAHFDKWTVVKAIWDGTGNQFSAKFNIDGGDTGWNTYVGGPVAANSEALVVGQRSNLSGSSGPAFSVDYVKVLAGATVVGNWLFNEGSGQIAASTTGINTGQLGQSSGVDFRDPAWASENTVLVAGAGPVAFPSTAVLADFASPSGGNVTVQQFSAPPVSVSGVTEPDVQPASWVIEADSGFTFGNTTEVRFKLSDVPGAPIPFPTSVVVYKRDTPNTGAFGAVATTWDSGAGEVVASGFTSFSEFILAHDVNLPVELANFEVVTSGNEASLRWETLSESNNAGFEIQSSVDGVAFERIGFVEGQGSTNEPHHYDFVASDLAPGNHAFRLKQIDFDGAFEYTSTVETVVEVPGEYVLEAAYPNPFNPSTTLRFGVAVEQVVKAVLYNAVGQAVSVLFEGNVGANEMQSLGIDASSLPSGTYAVRVTGESFSAVERITLVK